MDRLGLTRLALATFLAGIFAWIFPNLAADEGVNAGTDVAIVAFGIVALVGLGRAVDGVGRGALKVGLVGVAVGQLAQNAVSAFDLAPISAAPVVVVLLASVLVIVGALRWSADGWDAGALALLAAGFAGFGFEGVYYLGSSVVQGSYGGYFPGTVLVGVGGLLAAWSFWAARDEDTDLD